MSFIPPNGNINNVQANIMTAPPVQADDSGQTTLGFRCTGNTGTSGTDIFFLPFWPADPESPISAATEGTVEILNPQGDFDTTDKIGAWLAAWPREAVNISFTSDQDQGYAVMGASTVFHCMATPAAEGGKKGTQVSNYMNKNQQNTRTVDVPLASWKCNGKFGIAVSMPKKSTAVVMDVYVTFGPSNEVRPINAPAQIKV